MYGDGDVLIAPRLLRLLRAARPDLVHLHSRIGADIWGGIAGRLAGVPVIHTRRVDNPEPRLAVALKYRLHDRVVAISEAIGRVLVSEGLPPAKLRVVRSAVDWESWARPGDCAAVAGRLGVPADAVLIGVVAQLIPRKGHRFLLEALPPLLARQPAIRVVFFGRGALEDELRRTIAATGLDGVVRLAGFRDDLPDILPCLDLLVHPATMEGLGVSLLQAASAGVPIVASVAGGIPEAVRDGENGLLVPPGDVPALREAVGALLADPARRRALGQGGRRPDGPGVLGGRDGGGQFAALPRAAGGARWRPLTQDRADDAAPSPAAAARVRRLQSASGACGLQSVAPVGQKSSSRVSLSRYGQPGGNAAASSPVSFVAMRSASG
jgi:glycosyltransferase involved in cell wall biosynthesis